jgi:asparagine synthase (glutamine-hydrolysing)
MTGYFNPDGVLRERAAQARYPRITPRRAIMDLSLTCVVATQLWHHTFFGGGLCDLPSWSPSPLREASPPSLDVLSPLEASCSVQT